MITNYISVLLSLCFLLINTTAIYAVGPKETKEKIVKASYKVNANDLLELDNKYGNVQIKNHTGNSIEIEVNIKAWDGSSKKAQETLDRISIQREQRGRKVSLKTMIDHSDNNKVVLNSSKGFHVNYVIKMPQQMSLDLENKFGNVELESILGTVELEVKHGNLETGMLGEGEVEVKFGNVEIEGFQKRASVEVKHGNLEIGQATYLELKQAHGNCKLGTVEHLEGGLEHGNIKVKEIANNLIWESEFGNFSLGKIGATFEKIHLEVKHGNATMNFDAASKFNLAAKTEYGTIQHSMPAMTMDKGHTHQTAHGSVNGGGSASVDIAVDFGNINLH